MTIYKRRRTRVSKKQRLLNAGKCPHNEVPCKHTKLCILSKLESCVFLTQNLVAGCQRCKKINNGMCLYTCFRR